jgi:predicted NodU family carbamoyl transferase
MSNDKSALLLSLGHNSSAIFTDGTRVLGYEQERLDRIKSSSASPVNAILEIKKHIDLSEVPIFCTHWFDKFDKLPNNKYIQGLVDIFPETGIATHTKDFTHHDAHAWSSLSFFRYYKDQTIKQMTLNELIPVQTNYIWFLVADGFGNQQEVLSLYKALNSDDEPKLVFRCYGYQHSLGLMYQYATDFCGMKMNQDEYKFLGYESQATYVLSLGQKSAVDDLVSQAAVRFLSNWNKYNESPECDVGTIDLEALDSTKAYWHDYFRGVLDNVGGYDPTSNFARITIGYFIQAVLEKSLTTLVKKYGIMNLVLSGGVFYNVKANHALLESVKGLFSVVPLAGDQGASIGFYEKYVGHFNWETLSIGKRDLEQFRHCNSVGVRRIPNAAYIDNEEQLYETLVSKIRSGQICNLITEYMEYGPRALGSTSSLFLPTEKNSEFNNKLNQRNEVMPFAPLIPAEAMPLIFQNDYRRVVGSDRFMILTYNYIKSMTDDFRGVAHAYPYNVHCFSGRPEVIDYHKNKPLHQVLTDLWRVDGMPLVTNTSYNYHGEPIVFSYDDIVCTHYRQLDNIKGMTGKNPEVNLIIYKSKE